MGGHLLIFFKGWNWKEKCKKKKDLKQTKYN